MIDGAIRCRKCGRTLAVKRDNQLHIRISIRKHEYQDVFLTKAESVVITCPRMFMGEAGREKICGEVNTVVI